MTHRLLSVGVVFWLVGSALSIIGALSIRSTPIPISEEFGFGNILPGYFWVGFLFVIGSSILLGWYGKTAHRVLAIVSIALIMWCLPILIETLPRHNDAIWYSSVSQWIAHNHQIEFSPSGSQSYLFYLQYPGLFLLGAILSEFGVPVLLLADLYPILIVLLFSLGFFLLSRKLLGDDKQAFLVTTLSLVANVAFFSTHFSPSATAQALFPLVLLVTLRIADSSSKRSDVLVFLILTIFYSILHPAMQLLVLLLVMGTVIFQRVSRLILPAVFIATMFFSWMLYVGNWGLTSLSASLNSLDAAITLGLKTPASELVGHQTLIFPTVGLLKTGILVGFCASAFLVIVWRMRKNLRSFYRNRASLFFLLTFVAFGLASLVTVIYGHVLAWVIPFSILVVIGALNKKSKWIGPIFFGGLILLAPLTFLTIYSGEGQWITTQAEYQGLSFVAAHINDNTKLLIGDPSTFEYFTQYKINYTTFPFLAPSPGSAQNAEYYPVSLEWLNSSNAVVFQISAYNWQYYEIAGTSQNSYTTALNSCLNNVQFNLIYSDQDVMMFTRNGNSS